MKKSRRKKKIKNNWLIILIVIILIIFGIVGYKMYIEKDNGKSNDDIEEIIEDEDGVNVTKFDIILLNVNQAEYKLFYEKILNIQNEEDGKYLYINGIKVNHEYTDDDVLLITNRYIVALKGMSCGDKADFAFDYKGNVINVIEKYHDLDNENYPGQCKEAGILPEPSRIKIENGVLKVDVGYYDEKNNEALQKVEFAFDGEKIIIQKI